ARNPPRRPGYRGRPSRRSGLPALRQQPGNISRSPPSNLRETRMRTVQCNHSMGTEREPGEPEVERGGTGIYRPIPEEGRGEPGQGAGEGTEGNVLAGARSEAEPPARERVGRGRRAREEGDGGLNQEPPQAGVARRGDRAPPRGLAGAAFAGH